MDEDPRAAAGIPGPGVAAVPAVLVALWVWRTSWPAIARVAVIGGLAGWNLLVFVPRPS
jgi:hypothetical protein